VGDGLEVNEKPRTVDADHVIVAWLITSMPVEPGGPLTSRQSVTGPLQVMSNEQVAGVDTGSINRNSAFGMVKKATRLASGAPSHHPVDPSMSVNRKVTVPEGAPAPASSRSRCQRHADRGDPLGCRQVPVARRSVPTGAGDPSAAGPYTLDIQILKVSPY
jgi:hypothetical protein